VVLQHGIRAAKEDEAQMRRSTIIFLIIFSVLGIFVWFMQRPGNIIKAAFATSTTNAPVLTETLISPERGPINSISIISADGKSINIDKASGQWIVKTDHDQPADQNLAESAAAEALNLHIIKVFDTPPDPVGTGLDKPVYNVSLLLSDGKLYSFKIGKQTVTGSGYYSETPDKKVIILSKSEVDALINNFLDPPILKNATPPPDSGKNTPTPDASPRNIEGTATGGP
jgi:hypothetical protein